ncbi:MAG: DUF481 domain-containing protein [Planctomycetota bacterium]|nr:MAG: DUF481 domain-containing protein [Planctomycetota bacterium]
MDRRRRSPSVVRALAFIAALGAAAWTGSDTAIAVQQAAVREEQAAPRWVVTLTTGDVLVGEIVAWGEKTLTLHHPLLGQVQLPVDRILRVEERAAAAQRAQRGERGEQEETQSPAPAQPIERVQRTTTPSHVAAAPKPREKWKGAVELGLNGSEGNTERVNVRFSAEATRERPRDELYLAALYRTALENQTTVENRLELRSRQEWKSAGDERPWRLFLTETLELDEFQDYDARVAMSGGFRYRFLDSKATRLIVRVGGGFSREIGSPDDAIKPEALASVELRHAFNSRLELRSLGEIYPDLQDTGEFRSLLRGSLDILLTDDKSLKLRLGAEHRFDSTPGQAKSTDVDYFLTLVYSF